jgi:hypothetical protein
MKNKMKHGIDINKEAEKYINNIDEEFGTMWTEDKEELIEKIVYFANNSKSTQSKVLQAQIEENNSILEMLKIHGNERCVFVVKDRIEELQQKLKRLEDEK